MGLSEDCAAGSAVREAELRVSAAVGELSSAIRGWRRHKRGS